MNNRKIAQLYDFTSQLIAHCANTPQAIAKAAQEHPQVRFYQAWGSGGIRHISALSFYLHDLNDTASEYVAVAGVVATINKFDPAELIDN